MTCSPKHCPSGLRESDDQPGKERLGLSSPKVNAVVSVRTPGTSKSTSNTWTCISAESKSGSSTIFADPRRFPGPKMDSSLIVHIPFRYHRSGRTSSQLNHETNPIKLVLHRLLLPFLIIRGSTPESYRQENNQRPNEHNPRIPLHRFGEMGKAFIILGQFS